MRLFDTIRQDARHAIRVLMQNRGFAAVAILSLALGIGANTAIFTLIDTVLLRSLPVQDPERLVVFALDPDDEHAARAAAITRPAMPAPATLRQRPEPLIRRASLDCRLDRHERFLDERSSCAMHGLQPDL